MQNDHLENCGCKDCLDSNSTPFGGDNIDQWPGKPSDYLDGELYAMTYPVNVYSSTKAGNRLLRTVKPGNRIGKIFSFIKEPDGFVWWQLEDNGFVIHSPIYLDFSKLKKSVDENKVKTQAKIQAATEEKIKQNVNPLYSTGKAIERGAKNLSEGVLSFGSNLKWILIGVIVIAVLFLLLQLKK